MTIRTNFYHALCTSTCIVFLAGCNTSALNPGSTTNSIATIDTRTTNAANSQGNPVPAQTIGSETALAAQDPTTPAQAAVAGQTSDTSFQTAALNTENSISFLPVSGAPQGAVTALSRSLRVSAQGSGLSLIPANQPGAKYQVKGYFSALDDGSGTLLVYVWDVLDSTGNRLHRINGQERTTSKSTDPWQAVGANEFNSVAGTTVARLNSWLNSTSQ